MATVTRTEWEWDLSNTALWQTMMMTHKQYCYDTQLTSKEIGGNWFVFTREIIPLANLVREGLDLYRTSHWLGWTGIGPLIGPGWCQNSISEWLIRQRRHHVCRIHSIILYFEKYTEARQPSWTDLCSLHMCHKYPWLWLPPVTQEQWCVAQKSLNWLIQLIWIAQGSPTPGLRHRLVPLPVPETFPTGP